MKVIKTINAMRQWAYEQRAVGKKIGFVPTMGFLHEGHLTLIREARRKCDTVVVSIFVNPTQFAPNEDLEQYPRDFERDQQLCEQEKADVVFYPPVEEMYLPGHITYVNTKSVSSLFEGETRPTHFEGVTTIVTKLFNIVLPHLAVFGQKDAQQAFILKRMVKDLDFDIEMVIAPIIREKDGLAMSSRNKYLSETQRVQANILYRSLTFAEEKLLNGEKDYEYIKKEMLILLDACSEARVDYIAFVDADTFKYPEKEAKKIRILIAVYFGTTRLIDNLAVAVDS